MSFDMFSTRKVITQVTNRQIGISGGGVGVTGDVGGSLVIGSGTAVGNAVTTYGDVNIISQSVEALEAMQRLASESVNAASQNAIRALETLQVLNVRSSDTTEQAVNRAMDVKTLSLPGGEEVLTGASSKKALVTIAVIVTIGAIVIYARRR